MTSTITRPAAIPLETMESYDRENGNLIYRSETPVTDTPSKLSSDGGALTSPTVAELFTALSKAQGEIEHALKDTDGQTGNQTYVYATLGNVYDASRRHLRDNGLAVTHRQRTVEGGVEVEAIMTHVSGEWISGGVLFMPCELEAKKIGSALTYARRYTYSAIVGIAAEDDDGTAASESTSGGAAKKKPAAKKGGAAAAKKPAGKFGPLTEWRWGQEKGTPLALVSEKSLEWLIGQEKFGSPEDRETAAAELASRKAERVPGGDAETQEAAAEPAPEPDAAELTPATADTLIELLISTGLAPDEEAAGALIEDKGDGTEAWGTRQITLLRQRTEAAEQGDADA
jgi:hypothetical protein